MKSKEKKNNVSKKTYNIVGLLDLLFILSVSYLIVIVVMGTDSLEPKILAVPATLGVAFKLAKRFTN